MSRVNIRIWSWRIHHCEWCFTCRPMPSSSSSVIIASGSGIRRGAEMLPSGSLAAHACMEVAMALVRILWFGVFDAGNDSGYPLVL